MHIIETRHYYTENEDLEIWIDGNLTYSIHNGLEREYEKDESNESPFIGMDKVTTVYQADIGKIQHNISDGSFYFIRDDGTMAPYVDGELKASDPDGEYNEFIKFANNLLSQ
ncbi:hypothetical protein R0H17_25255 [Phytobacter diazotrophicus]|jgi:hypothetical protein|uniref:hypothetical protein n=1 Tax=Phytobacter diazotrophicus TaxID=395631 RepID=UPI002936108E|nr:hypothetical protein [Phytobacter diazotrophicus]MDV2904933.1 hypothetical protein [Phytobacter diazotrophicus]